MKEREEEQKGKLLEDEIEEKRKAFEAVVHPVMVKAYEKGQATAGGGGDGEQGEQGEKFFGGDDGGARR